MQIGNVDGQKVYAEVWCDKCAEEGVRKGSFTSTDKASVQPCQKQGCNDPMAEVRKAKKK